MTWPATVVTTLGFRPGGSDGVHRIHVGWAGGAVAWVSLDDESPPPPTSLHGMAAREVMLACDWISEGLRRGDSLVEIALQQPGNVVPDLVPDVVTMLLGLCQPVAAAGSQNRGLEWKEPIT